VKNPKIVEELRKRKKIFEHDVKCLLLAIPTFTGYDRRESIEKFADISLDIGNDFSMNISIEIMKRYHSFNIDVSLTRPLHDRSIAVLNVYLSIGQLHDFLESYNQIDNFLYELE